MAAMRPYFKLGIAELESIFEAARADSVICSALIEELGHRNTERSAVLLRQVQAAMSELETKRSRSAALASVVLSTNHSAALASSLPKVAGGPQLTASTQVMTEVVARNIPPETNKPAAILAAWTALEALSPQTYRRPVDLVNGDGRCVTQFEGNDLPWLRGEQSRRNYQLYYQVVLGSVLIDRATDALIKAFGEDEERSGREREKAVLAAVLVDRNGVLLQENGVAISSFGWALPIALTGQLDGLGAWTSAERALVEGLTKQLARTDREGKPLPLDAATLQQSFQWLVDALKIPTGLCEAPNFVLRVYHYFKSKNPPEVTLLNSFFLADLSRASGLLDSGRLDSVLSRYLGAEKAAQSPNLLATPDLVETLVAPVKTPLTRWPAPGGHPLVTLQQAAVNAARAELAGQGSGIVAVNGPPGTGKTTLLRDIVAGCVLDRALAMARFEDPISAFRTTGQKVSAGGNAFLHLYSLDESLKGHEVLVASSNNKAVENVSKELPSIKAVGRDLTYFKTVSDRLLAKRSEEGGSADGEQTWGLIAAVLGNALNRGAFQQALWWDDDRSLRLYLKAAKGDSVVREITDESGRVIKREVPAIITAESPPSPEEARVNWKKVRGRFTKLHTEIEMELRALESVRQTCLKLAPARDVVSAASANVESASKIQGTRLNAVAAAQDLRKSVSQNAADATRREQQALTECPGWLHRLFNTKRMRKWREAYAPLALDCKETERRLAETISNLEQSERLLQESTVSVRLAQGRLAEAQAALAALEQFVESHRAKLGTRMVDEAFFQQGHEQWNLASPWLPDELHRKREDLFATALEMHRAFIDVAAQKVSHNLGVLMGCMQAGAFQEDAKKALLKDLWSTLFLVCPVVSTTFASVDRMLGDLPSNSFGWVLVDEAGQATPQSAVGMLMRARRAIIVGDPLQIPPVVSLPQRLVLEVAKYFGVSPAIWLAPEASVQTLADQASRWKAEFRGDVGIREVGIPLLVHRRCQEPMFGISNRIAYDGQMVHAAGRPSAGPVAKALGASRWVDVDGTADSKWCPAEGDAVVQLLLKLVAEGVTEPDVYVITPFRIVANELRRRIGDEPRLLNGLGVDADDWLRNRVGTIHTFQGKEAEAVIAVLGAPMAAQQGARRWAASTPNILNVMVSRAKQTLYVVGSRAAWSTAGHGRAVSDALGQR